MPDPRDRLDLSHDPRPGQHDPAAPRAGEPSRFLGLWFSCAGQYARATKDPSGAAYVGHCPECGKQARFPIGPGGTDARTFTVSCR